MRILAAILLTVVLVAGARFYTAFSDSVRSAPLEIKIRFDEAVWGIRIARTFDCIGDPNFGVPSLSVQFNGQSVLNRTDVIPSGEEIAILKLPKVEVGKNELVIEANSDASTKAPWGALRVQVFRDSTAIVDQSLWLDQDATSITETISFIAPDVAVDDRSDEHEH